MLKLINQNSKKFFVLVVLSLILGNLCYGQQGVISVKGNMNGMDATPLVIRAIKDCKDQKAKKIIFAKGKYEFWPDYTTEKYAFISNNDYGLKNVLFDLSDLSNIEIDGQGSEFLFHGYVCPFILDNAKKIEIKNLSINYARTFHSEGIISVAYDDSLDISFSSSYPYKVQNERLMFYDEKGIQYPFSHLLEFSTAKRELAYMALDYITGIENMRVRELSAGVVRLYLAGLKGNVGNTLVFNAKNRTVPAITIIKSQEIKISNVTIFHSGGMGVIGQLSKNIILDGLKVTPATGRMISLTADPTHFVNCRGNIIIQNCLMENQMDDAGNIHNIYARVEQVKSSKEVVVKMVHYQQVGIDIFSPGAKVEFVRGSDLTTYHDNVVSKVDRLNKDYTRLTFQKPIDKEIKVGHILGSLDHAPNLLIKNCIVRNNRARGFLLGTRGKIVVEGNYFHTWWGALDLYANGSDWYEQGGVRDVTIRDNTFDNCNYGLNVGLGIIIDLIQLTNEPPNGKYYHKNILIENNNFRIFNPNILTLVSIDSLTFKNNKIEHNTEYVLPKWLEEQKIEKYSFKYSRNIVIKD
jgi:hypothetical protein